MAGNHTETTNKNKEFLIHDLGLKQHRNTTIFTKDDIFILSPSVGNQYNWFDIRQVNIEKFTSKYNKGFLLIRFFNELLLADLREFISSIIDINKFADTKNSGVHWKFRIYNSSSDDSYKIVNLISKKEFEISIVEEKGIKLKLI